MQLSTPTHTYTYIQTYIYKCIAILIYICHTHVSSRALPIVSGSQAVEVASQSCHAATQAPTTFSSPFAPLILNVHH